MMLDPVQHLRLRPTVRALLAAASIALLAPLATAQNEQDPVKPVMEVDEATDTIAFSMNESNGMELTEFIKWAQEVTGKRFTYNAQELAMGNPQAGTISFLGTFRIQRERFQEDFFSFFQTMLYIKGFAAWGRGIGNALWKRGDQFLIDGVLVNGTANSVGRLAAVMRQLQSGYLYTYAFAMIIGLTMFLGWLIWFR